MGNQIPHVEGRGTGGTSLTRLLFRVRPGVPFVTGRRCCVPQGVSRFLGLTLYRFKQTEGHPRA